MPSSVSEVNGHFWGRHRFTNPDGVCFIDSGVDSSNSTFTCQTRLAGFEADQDVVIYQAMNRTSFQMNTIMGVDPTANQIIMSIPADRPFPRFSLVINGRAPNNWITEDTLTTDTSIKVYNASVYTVGDYLAFQKNGEWIQRTILAVDNS